MMRGMNPYQKSAVLVLRLAAAYFVVSGFLAAMVAMSGKMTPQRPLVVDMNAEILVRNGAWVIFGLFLWLFAKPLGRFFGKGLD